MRCVLILILLYTSCCLSVSLGNKQQCITNEEQCIAMFTFQKTYNSVRDKADEMTALVRTLKLELDSAIELSCGNIGVNAVSNLYSFNLTHCDFEDGNAMCGFTQNRDDNSDWAIDNAFPDHTFGSKMGHSLKAWVSHLVRVTSKPFNPAHAYCIRFFYKAESNPPTIGKLNVYLQVGNLRGYPVFSVSNIPAHDWTLAEITPDPEYLSGPFQIVFEANNLNQFTYIDDLSVYNAPCTTEGIQTPRCPPGAVETNMGGISTCYVFHVEQRTYMEAIKACKAIWPQASLLAIETAAEQAFVANMINSSKTMSIAVEYGLWTNGNDIDVESAFVWNGQAHPIAMNYTHWHPGQPNNVAGNQDCVLIQYPKPNYEWGDVSCSEKHSFICEMNYVPKDRQHFGNIFG